MKMKCSLTSPQGFAMKLGTTPLFMPMLFARYLNNTALSAIRRALVYARAVSYTPGPVSVSVSEDVNQVCQLTIDSSYDGLLWEFRTYNSRRINLGSNHYLIASLAASTHALIMVVKKMYIRPRYHAHFRKSTVEGS